MGKRKLIRQEQTDNEVIEIIGAREHNLKDVHLILPREKFIVITGISGSGKSSLAFDTLNVKVNGDTWKVFLPMHVLLSGIWNGRMLIR